MKSKRCDCGLLVLNSHDAVVKLQQIEGYEQHTLTACAYIGDHKGQTVTVPFKSRFGRDETAHVRREAWVKS